MYFECFDYNKAKQFTRFYFVVLQFWLRYNSYTIQESEKKATKIEFCTVKHVWNSEATPGCDGKI